MAHAGVVLVLIVVHKINIQTEHTLHTTQRDTHTHKRERGEIRQREGGEKYKKRENSARFAAHS